MNARRILPLLGLSALFFASVVQAETNIKHVLLISVDGLHALDVSNYVATHRTFRTTWPHTRTRLWLSCRDTA